MEAFNFHNRLRHISKLFRVGEILFVLLLLSWTSTRLPFAVKISGEYLRQLIIFIISPLFIFILSNIIVITLIIKFCQSNNADTDLYEELLGSDEIGLNFGPETSPPEPEQIEIVYQDKQIISELNKSVPKPVILNQKFYQRSKSETLKIEPVEKPEGKLRRSGTEKFHNTDDSDEKQAEKVELVDKLSNEDFQRTIEAFIARQLKFHKEEKLAVLIPAIASN